MFNRIDKKSFELEPSEFNKVCSLYDVCETAFVDIFTGVTRSLEE